MQRIILSLGALLGVSGLCAQQQSQTPSQQQHSQPSSQENQAPPGKTALDKAPEQVKEQVMRHAGSAHLRDLSAHQLNGMTIYRAQFQGENTETTLRMAEDGSPLSMHIVGTGAQMNEVAGADRSEGSVQNPPSGQARNVAQNQQSGDALQSGEQINEAAGARRDEFGANEEERNIQRLEQTQDPGETQGIPNSIRQRIQQQLGDTAVEGIKPRTFYELNIRRNGNLQQVWADDKGTLLKPQQ